jgi:beta-aspartyl-dipeptidase (metallo-type)
MILLCKNGNIYAPQAIGQRDILVAGNRIAGIYPTGFLSENDLRAIDPEIEILDADGLRVMPGIIDRHVHFNGAGGEGGPANRTPPLQLSSFINAGITSAVGMLGTDGTCRSLRELLAKAFALEKEGISTWILTGSYRMPSATLTGGIADDICLIDKVIGLKIALSDHRCSHPSPEEIRSAVSDSRLGGILSGKSGTVCVHMGDEASGFSPLVQAIENTGIPPAQFAPTHISRNQTLLEEAVGFASIGGTLDITADPEDSFGVPLRDALKFLLDRKVSPKQITLSSDGNGSSPRFDENGKLVGMGIGPVNAVLKSLLKLWDDPEFDIETVISMATSNVAEQLNLNGKGRIIKGADADFLVLDKITGLRHVVAGGTAMMKDGVVLKKGTFE